MRSFWKNSGNAIFDAIAIPEKKACTTSLQFKNRTQELDFLKTRYYALSVLIKHFFFKIKYQNHHASWFWAR